MFNSLTIFMKKARWIEKKGYLQGAFWTLMCCLASNLNDILMKSMGDHLHSFQIVFFRAFLGSIMIIPFLAYNKESLKTPYPGWHLSRILIGMSAITLACYATTLFSLPEVTTLSFSQPLLFLPMAVLFLKEKLTYERVLANILGFIGVVIVLSPQNRDFFSLTTLIPLGSAFLFANLDIITKKQTTLEKPLTLIFYFNLGVTVLAGFFSIFVWKMPSLTELFLLFLLAISATFIQFSSFMSLSATSILALAPLRYSELLFSCCFSILLFHEFPTSRVFLGSALIIGGVLYATRAETSKKVIE